MTAARVVVLGVDGHNSREGEERKVCSASGGYATAAGGHVN